MTVTRKGGAGTVCSHFRGLGTGGVVGLAGPLGAPGSPFWWKQAAQAGGLLEVVPEAIECGEGVHTVDLAAVP